MLENENQDKEWDFKEQLVVGDRGQELFLQHYHQPLTIYPKHAADFKVVSTGELLELKTDTYNMEKSENFFFERWSSVYEKKPGGPWQSMKHKVPIYCYMFVRHNTYFEFRTKELCAELDKMTEGKGLIFVKNKFWVTGGYKIPRESLKHLYTQYTFEVQK